MALLITLILLTLVTSQLIMGILETSDPGRLMGKFVRWSIMSVLIILLYKL